MAKVSVIIPCYNYGRFLKRCLDSVLAQTYKNLEIIVINDGSTDETRHVLRKYGSKILSFHNPRFTGVGAARNQGLNFASGTLCLFLDADDYLAPSYLKKMVPVLLKSGAGLVYCSFYYVLPQRSKLIQAVPFDRNELLKDNYITVNSLVRKDLVKMVGGFDNELIIQDYDLWLRITHISDAVAVREPLFYYVVHGDNDNLTMPQERRIREIHRIRRRVNLGLFLRNNRIIYVVTSKRIKHEIPEHLIYEAGLDAKDIFYVSQESLNQFDSGPAITSLNNLKQTVATENYR